MTTRFRMPLLVLALLAAPAGAQQSPGDFQLPPAPAPTQNPDVQGPVDTEGAVPMRPRAIPTRAPARRPPAAQPAPPPAPAATPTASPPTARPAATPLPRPANRQVPAAPPVARPSAAPEPRAPAPEPLPTSVEPAPPLAPVPEGTRTPVAEPASEAAGTETGSWWVAALAVLGLGALGGAQLLRRRGRNAPVPQIEKPIVGGAGPGLAAQGALNLRVEALRMSRSLMNATLAYRVTVLNRSASPLSDVAVEADLASAHGELPMEQQVAGPGTALEQRHATKRLAAGQSARFEGQVILPLATARLIRQGQAALLVPLLRLRARAAGVEPVARTLAIGPAASGGGARLLPFNLGDGPRSYEPLAQKAID